MKQIKRAWESLCDWLPYYSREDIFIIISCIMILINMIIYAKVNLI